jgi:cellulose synthase/poly-beta-1,6-N-acetylglucosamine synthase-like glycosyltransferase
MVCFFLVSKFNCIPQNRTPQGVFGLIIQILEAITVVITALMLAYTVRHYIFTISALKETKKQKTPNPQSANYEPTVSILIPAKNEENVIGRLMQRITELTYPKNKLQIVVIDDASTDQTGEIADKYSQTYPYVQVIHRTKSSNGKGKAAAMNEGFKQLTGEIVLCFDADYFPQKNIVENLVSPFSDPTVGGVQGRVVVLNEPQNLVTRLVTLERVGGYRVDQQARDRLGLITQFGGTVGGFRRSLLENLNGWDASILAEDTDLTFRVYLAGYKVRYVVDAECYEEAVDSWRAYERQRYRWAKGHMQCVFKHSVNVMQSKNLSFKEKLDGLMLLNVYFMPLLALVSLFIGLPLVIFGVTPISRALWFMLPFLFYSCVGNFAPFFEIGVGLYLDGRNRTQWLLPLLIFPFFYNIYICLKAFLAVTTAKILRRDSNVWDKTSHLGGGNDVLKVTVDKLHD